jgi:hypothetical protein
MKVMATLELRRTFARAFFAIVMSYVLAFQGFALAAPLQKTVDPFSVICSHNGSIPNHQDHRRHQHPCCKTNTCSMGAHLMGPPPRPDDVADRVASSVPLGIAAARVAFHHADHAAFDARGPPPSF